MGAIGGDYMDENIRKKILDKLKLVPNLPGSYQMKNKDNVIIYVGKAKNLHNYLHTLIENILVRQLNLLVKYMILNILLLKQKQNL